MNLLAYLMTEYLMREGGPSALPLDTNVKLHALDALLAPPLSGARFQPPTEPQVLAAYLELPAEDLEALPPMAHEWFAERLSITTAVPDFPRLAERVARIYFLGGGELHQYLSVNALLAIDARLDGLHSHVQAIWSFILSPDNFRERSKPEMLEQVSEILLDLAQLTADSRYAERALRELWLGLEDYPEARQQVAQRVRTRAESAGGERGGRLAALMSDEERR